MNLKLSGATDLGMSLYVMDEKRDSYDKGRTDERQTMKLCIKYVRQGLSDVDIAAKLGKDLSEVQDTIRDAREVA